MAATEYGTYAAAVVLMRGCKSGSALDQATLLDVVRCANDAAAAAFPAAQTFDELGHCALRFQVLKHPLTTFLPG
jgi:hypothetical protein